MDMSEKQADTQNGPQSHRGSEPQTPKLCVDLLIDMGSGLVLLIERKNTPHGWALPGGFVDIGESVEEAALREAREETGLDLELVRLFHVYSEPNRDPRGHTASVVFVARARGQAKPKAGSDAARFELFHEMNLPPEIAFDHRQILRDYFLQRY